MILGLFLRTWRAEIVQHARKPHNGGHVGENLSVLLRFRCFFRLFWFLWFLIIPEWQVKDWGHILMFFSLFQIWTFPPFMHHQNILKIQETLPNTFKQYYFTYTNIVKS